MLSFRQPHLYGVQEHRCLKPFWNQFADFETFQLGGYASPHLSFKPCSQEATVTKPALHEMH